MSAAAEHPQDACELVADVLEEFFFEVSRASSIAEVNVAAGCAAEQLALARASRGRHALEQLGEVIKLRLDPG